MAERLRRYVQVVVNFVGVGSSPTECIFFKSFMFLVTRKKKVEEKKKKKEFGGTGIRARVKRITTAYANHYTIPPVLNTGNTTVVYYQCQVNNMPFDGIK